MLFGASSLLNLDKSSTKKNEEEFNFDDKSHLLIVSKSLQTVKDGRSYEVLLLPSPSNPLTGEYYLLGNDKVYRLQGIQPSENRVSVFVGDFLSNPDSILATFEFDLVFIFISILYNNKDKYLTMPSRIVEFYGNRSGDYSASGLQSSLLSVWNQNLQKVKSRMEYLCDVLESQGSKELLLRPNSRKFKRLLHFKVNNMVKYTLDNNLMVSDFSDSSVTSSTESVTKHLVTVNEERCRLFCWSILKSYLSQASCENLVPPEAETSLSKQAKVERKPELVPHTHKRPKPKPTAKGTPSITSFFRAK